MKWFEVLGERFIICSAVENNIYVLFSTHWALFYVLYKTYQSMYYLGQIVVVLGSVGLSGKGIVVTSKASTLEMSDHSFIFLYFKEFIYQDDISQG